MQYGFTFIMISNEENHSVNKQGKVCNQKGWKPLA